MNAYYNENYTACILEWGNEILKIKSNGESDIRFFVGNFIDWIYKISDWKRRSNNLTELLDLYNQEIKSVGVGVEIEN